MRKAIAVILAVALSLPAVGQGVQMLALPAWIEGGKPSLLKWLDSRKQEIVASTEAIRLSESDEVLVVYQSTGSGRPLVDAFVYTCRATSCFLVSAKRAIEIDPRLSAPLSAQVDAARGVVEIQTPAGGVQLRATIADQRK